MLGLAGSSRAQDQNGFEFVSCRQAFCAMRKSREKPTVRLCRHEVMVNGECGANSVSSTIVGKIALAKVRRGLSVRKCEIPRTAASSGFYECASLHNLHFTVIK